MKRRIFLPGLVLVLLIISITGCSDKTKTDQKKAEAIRSYSATIGDDAGEYFSDLSESACGVVPECVYCSISEYTSDEVLEKPPVAWQEMIQGTPPVIIAELHKKTVIYHAEEDCYTPEEIHDILAEAVKRGLVMVFCFDTDSQTYTINQEGRIIFESIRGSDGGAYREKYDYEL